MSSNPESPEGTGDTLPGPPQPINHIHDSSSGVYNSPGYSTSGGILNSSTTAPSVGYAPGYNNATPPVVGSTYTGGNTYPNSGVVPRYGNNYYTGGNQLSNGYQNQRANRLSNNNNNTPNGAYSPSALGDYRPPDSNNTTSNGQRPAAPTPGGGTYNPTSGLASPNSGNSGYFGTPGGYSPTPPPASSGNSGYFGTPGGYSPTPPPQQ